MTAFVPQTQRPPLRRALHTPVAGVCLGLARHLNLSVPVVRAAMIGLTVAGGLGVVLYCWLWMFVPAEDEPFPEAGVRGLSGEGAGVSGPDAGGRHDDADPGPEATGRLRRVLDSLTGSPEVLVGGLLLGVAGILALQMLGVGVDWWLIGPAAVLVVGVLLAWSQVDAAGFRTVGSGGPESSDPAGEGRGRQAVLWQFAAGAFLVLVALLVMAGGFVPAGELILSLVLAGMLLAGVALVTAPWLVKLYRTMSVERTRAAAEAERADIAAHLHDSVLQTLAMIQKQRHDPAAVEQLARSQERQLRGWLYRQDRHEQHHAGAAAGGSSAAETPQPDRTLKQCMLDVAAELEELHSVPVEVVTVGKSRRAEHGALVAAAREAIVNALKHAGPASVYVESSEQEDAVFVRDRGTGFDVEAVLRDQVGDRLGVRESITGRMRRAGGEARIRSGERGTEVQLIMPAEAGGQEDDE